MSTHSWADGLVRRVVPDGEVRVLQCLFARDASRRVKVEHLGEQIEGEWVRVRKHLRKRHSRPDGQRTDVILCLEVVSRISNSTSKNPRTTPTTDPGRT